MKFQKRLESIKEKLAQLKAKDKDMTIFGAGDDKLYGTIGHHYELNSVLNEDQIVAVEKKLGIKLPEEYREFLQVVGDGGAGPEWGLFNLEKTFGSDEFMAEYPDFCSMECAYGDDYANGIKGQLDKDPYYTEKVEAFGGYLRMADYGHGRCAYMVVGGDQQVGKIWFMDEDGEAPHIVPAIQKIPEREWQVTFLDWYENWLDDSLDKINQSK